MKRLLFLVVFFSSFSNVLFGQVVINEICPANADINYDPIFYNFSGWVELYNKGNASLNITGYYLSNDESIKTKWQLPYGSIVPAKGYLTIWCDEENYNLHTNFKLDNDGETLLLYKGSMVIIALTNHYFQFPLDDIQELKRSHLVIPIARLLFDIQQMALSQI